MVDLQVNLPVFSGPFALLFHLIEKAEVDIYEISVAEITSQYLQALREMQELNLEIAAEFLVMAATLLKLKSKKLLPETVEVAETEEEEMPVIDSREELVQRLLEYRYFRDVAAELRRCEAAQKRVYIRSLGGKALLVNPDEEITLAGVTLPALLEAFQRVLTERERQPQESAPDDLSVQDKMQAVLKAVRGKKDGVDFRELFSPQAGIAEIITTFIALLELIRLRKIVVWQSGPFGRLLVMRKS